MKIHAQLANAVTSPTPELTVYAPATPAGIGMVIFPGGGYGHLAEHEGRGYAEFLARHGITAVVARYRLGSDGHRHPAMLEDGLAAVATVRQRAAEFGVRTDCIGVMGSSAGGHLAAHVLTEGARRAPELRPDFGVLCYPLVSMRPPFEHAKCRSNLLGDDAPADTWDAVSCETLVTANTPPCFLWHTVDDKTVPVEHSLIFAAALRRQNVPFELHVFPDGGHGAGLEIVHPWGELCVAWLRRVCGLDQSPARRRCPPRHPKSHDRDTPQS